MVIFRFLVVAVLIVVLSLLPAYIVFLIWNWFAHSVTQTHLPTFSFFQILAVMFILGIIGNFFRSGTKS